MSSLPNLSGLHLGRRSCQPCKPAAPIGKLYSDIYQARDYEDAGCPKKTQERGGGWDKDDAVCGICFELLRGPADVGLQRWDPPLTRAERVEIQALCEDPICGHAFHAQCLYRYIWKGGRNCPICRTEMNRNVLYDATREQDEYDQRREQFLNQSGNEALREAYRATLPQNQDPAGGDVEGDVEGEEEEDELDSGEAERLDYLDDRRYTEERGTPNLLMQFYPERLQDVFRLYRATVNEDGWNEIAHNAFKILRSMMYDRFVPWGARIDETTAGRLERFEDLYVLFYPGAADDVWRAFLLTAVEEMVAVDPGWRDSFVMLLT